MIKYKEVALPYMTNRTAIWIAAQLMLNFAAFILGAPIFVVICEYIGWSRKDPRYERLAKEVTKVTAVAYSLTALTGGLFTLLLIGLYPKLSAFLVTYFFPIWLLFYPFMFILETLLMYTYWYTWDTLADRKGLHISIGVLLNIVGTLVMFLMNAITGFMNTPVRAFEEATLWELMNNFTWWPLNIHRFIANVTFGGFITALVAAVMYMTSKTGEDRAFYDWMGFVGNLIGLATFMLLAFPGYLYGYEIYQYDASLGIYMMSDRLSMFFEMQGILIGLMYLAGNYYIWLSMKRITGAERFTPLIKAGFVLILICNAIWMTPRHFFATMLLEPGILPAGMDPDQYIAQMELPSHLGFMALMPIKNTAAFLSIVVILISYVLYRISIKRGTIRWGEIDPASQYTLIFLAFAAIWTMGLMGAVRSLGRKHFHIYILMKDMTPDAYTPTLAWSSFLVTLISLLFFALIGFCIWVGLGLGRAKQPIPVRGGGRG
jgi:cytochrome bd-type quinol oxidase subunit 1